MECESVAAVELTREIEEVIESPVREDMMMMATTNSSANAEGTDMDDKRDVAKSARKTRTLRPGSWSTGRCFGASNVIK